MNENYETPLYDLIGIVYHDGSLSSGHYTAACLNSTGGWFEFNDG
jgi:ubiquitin C-terminal hydrolase